MNLIFLIIYGTINVIFFPYTPEFKINKAKILGCLIIMKIHSTKKQMYYTF